uniref:Tyr recombinase domain-containing protein n=1 Tax=Caenorhabditis japonica TaxID=281687 RepID=A0A8R1I6L0_CAEJA
MDGEEYSPELMDTFAEKILEKLKPAIKMFAKQREEEKPPTLSQKGLQMQADLNTKLINMLESAMETGDLPGTIKKASELLKERNKELKLLDTDPEALKLVSKMRAVAEAAGTSSDTLDSKLLAIAQIVKEEKPREKRLPPTRSNRWFPGAGSIYRPSGVRSNNFYGYERVEKMSLNDFMQKCLSGATRVRDKATTQANVPSSEEVNKLQQSGVVVECRTPRVVSPLQVAVNEHSISRQREMAITVVEHQSMGETQRQQIPLSPARAVAEISKEKLASVGMVATHHALRRGAANHLQEKGLTFEQIKARGRWRSAGGVSRYLTDAPAAQGIVEEIAEESGNELTTREEAGATPERELNHINYN